MHNSGEIVRSSDLIDPATGRLSQICRRVVRLAGLSRSSDLTKDDLIISTLLKVTLSSLCYEVQTSLFPPASVFSEDLRR